MRPELCIASHRDRETPHITADPRASSSAASILLDAGVSVAPAMAVEVFAEVSAMLHFPAEGLVAQIMPQQRPSGPANVHFGPDKCSAGSFGRRRYAAFPDGTRQRTGPDSKNRSSLLRSDHPCFPSSSACDSAHAFQVEESGRGGWGGFPPRRPGAHEETPVFQGV
jgi:hypothetical protein